MEYLNGFFGELYERRKANPQDDLTSALVQAREDGGTQLSKAELVNVVVAMFGAGFETTAHLIGNGLLSLHRDRAQWDTLIRDPGEFAPRTVEEVLRFESSLQGSYRTALLPTTVAGTDVQPGEKVLCGIGSANRDEDVFDRPDTLDITRRDSRMLSFGGGIHHCVGQQLARLEGRVAFTAIAERLPQMTVDTRNPAWRPGFLFRGLEELHAQW
jgi:cytochrome P450